MDDNLNILNSNDIFQVLCENKKIVNFNAFLDHISEYIFLVKIMKEGIEEIKNEDSYVKEINFGEKIWRISMFSQFTKNQKLKFLFILDITSDLKINSMDKALSNMLNYVDDGVIVSNKQGNIVFYNISASNTLQTSLVGKNIKSISYFNNIQPNIKNSVKFFDKTLIIDMNFYGESY
ncbi:MAG: hypothetical protein ACK5XN_22125, partial [Bacteroidota bacterium]